MEKKRADFIIKQYVKPLYGFAVNKTKDAKQAEELASIIVLQVYSVLLNKTDIVDVNSYIFKVAHNVWVRYCNENFYGVNMVNIDNVYLSTEHSVDESLLQSEENGVLRREIAFLAKIRREIVMAYYYGNEKIAEIANQLDMPVGTVKWHLFECKKELKKGMEFMRKIGNLGLNPIKFSGMGHNGIASANGDTSNFLAKSLTQNIAYSCYFVELSIVEIAEELGVSPIFIEDEVKALYENGFMDIMPNGKYRTNILISRYNNKSLKESLIIGKYIDVLVDKYYSKLLDIREAVESLPIYYTDHDYNFLLWSLIMYAANRLNFADLDVVKYDEIAVIRKDGGHYIAIATINNNDYVKENDIYDYCGYMDRDDGNRTGLKLAVSWSGEPREWRDNLTSDYKLMYHFIDGSLPMDDLNLSHYETLVSKGYLNKEERGYTANIVYIPNRETKQALDELMPKIDDKIFEIAKVMDREVFAQAAACQPEHMHKTVRYQNQNIATQTHVYAMKNMLDRGMLKLPTEQQRKQICNILFNDV